ncbi:MAG TPA: BTAD domain-containing putative transcriptional regulator [Anaerolineales bacterium]|nr:BTAD domain-containing putative transcriptional regulator [Anaerolineales bacterium]
MPPTLTIRLLGRFEVERDGAIIPPQEWRGQKTRDLLKILLLASGQYVSRDQLCDWLWPEVDPVSAQVNLRAVVSDLRKILEPKLSRGRDSAFIVTHRAGYSFDHAGSAHFDFAEFHQAAATASLSRDDIETILALYRGDLLEEDPYAEWAMRTRDYLRELHLNLLSRYSDLLLQESAHTKCIAVCEQALTLDPSRESIWRTLIRAYDVSGDHAAALNTFDRCRAALSRDLGVDPSPETVALHEQILTADPQNPKSPDFGRSTPDAVRLRPTTHLWLHRLGAVGFTVWAVVTGTSLALSLAGIARGSFISPGDPGNWALTYLLSHPEALADINRYLYLLFPLGWLLLPGYVAWFTFLRTDRHIDTLAWIGLLAGIMDALTQTLSQAIGLAQLSVLPSAYLAAPVDQRLPIIALWDVLRQFASITGTIGLFANPIGLGLLSLASRHHRKYPQAIVWAGFTVVMLSALYYLLPPNSLSLPLGVLLAIGLRVWLERIPNQVMA